MDTNTIDKVDKVFMLNNVIPRVVANNYINALIMQKRNCVYSEIADLIVFYSINLDKDTSADVTKSIVERMGVSIDAIDAAAKENIKRNSHIQTLEGCLISLLKNEGKSVDASMFVPTETLVINTNSEKFGAGIITTDFLAEFVEDKYYIIPSSVHELLLMPMGMSSADELKKIVMEVNSTSVEACDKLSDSVYAIENGKLIVAA